LSYKLHLAVMLRIYNAYVRTTYNSWIMSTCRINKHDHLW